MQVIKFILTSLAVIFVAGLVLAIMFLSGFDMGLGTLLDSKTAQFTPAIEQPASRAPLAPIQQQQSSASLQKSVQQSRSTTSSSQKTTRRTSS